MLESVLIVSFAYLIGSLPTAYLVGRAISGIDIRQSGSQNPGALNAYRQMGKAAGLFVLLFDAGKGALAIFVGQQIGAPDIAIYTSAVVATLGHNFSPFLKFKGGKGAAIVLGISAIMLWQLTAITVVFGGALFALTRHALWSMVGVLVLLNSLTIVTSQTLGQIVVCASLTAIVAGTHLYRQHPDLLVALRHRNWRKFMSIE